MIVRTRMNRAAVRALSDAQARAATMTAMEILSRTRNAAVIPFDTGNTQNDSTYVDDSKVRRGIVSIVSDTPYARRIYYNPDGMRFRTAKNANAQQEWWESWLTGRDRVKAVRIYKEFYRRLTRGLVR